MCQECARDIIDRNSFHTYHTLKREDGYTQFTEEQPEAQRSYNLSQFVQLEAAVVVQLLIRVRLFVTPWTAAFQAFLSFIISWSLLKLMSIESVMPSNHLILCHPLLLPSVFPRIRVFSNESALRIRWT